MKHNLKLTLICITTLMIICIPSTAIAQKLRVSLREFPGNPETPKSGDYLRYSSSVSGGNVTGYQVTYTVPDFLGLKLVEGHWGTHDPKTRTITATGIRTTGEPVIGLFHFRATAAGTGELRIAGTVTTTQGTFNVDSRLPITVAPGLTIISPAQWYLGTQGPYIKIFTPSDHPETPRRGDVLRYSSSAARSSGEDVTGYQVTYTVPDFLGLKLVEGYWGTHDPKTRTITATGIRTGEPSTGDFLFRATAAGTGELRIVGTVTTTRGTFDVDSQLSVTIHPALTDPAPVVIAPKPTDPPPEPVVPVPLPEPLPVPVKDVVSIPDSKLAAAVRKALGLGTNATISKQMMQRLTTLRAGKSLIKNLTGLEHATRLVELGLFHNQIQDVSPLAGLTQLQRLYLQDNQITNITPLAKLTQLRRLHLWNNQIRDISVLSRLTRLESLWLESNQIEDVSSLAGLTNLTDLRLRHNQIRDISVLSGLTRLELLWLESNQIRDIRPLVGLTNLTALRLNGNPIQDKSPLRTLKQQNPKLKVDIEIPPLSPVVHIDPAQRPPLYWIGTTIGTLHRLIGDEVENLLPTVKNATSLAVDMAGRKLYWTEQTGNRTGRIRRANLDGSNVKLVKTLTSVPYAIALDPSRNKIYVTNAYGKVQRLNMNGSNFQPNLITELNAPNDIVVDSTGSKLYWIEQTSERSGRIRQANLDGSNVKLVKALTSMPLGIALDPSQNKIYVTNAYGKVQRLNTNGSNFQPNFITGLHTPKDVAVDVTQSQLYWTEKGNLRRADLSGTDIQDVVTGLGSPGSIVLGTASMPPVEKDPPTEPVPYASTDVNRDKKVNKTDLLLVVTALGETPPTNPNFDVNADGTVNIADVLLVIEELDDPITAAAPTNEWRLETSLDPSLLEAQLNILRAENDGSAKHEQALAFLQGFLASVRPTETQLLANYPNPFNPETWIPYQLAKASDVKITIYDARGVVVRQLDLGHQPAGIYYNRSRAAYWDGRNELGERVASSIYFYQLATPHFQQTRRLVIVK